MKFGPWFAMANSEFEDNPNGGIVTEAYLDGGGVPTGPGGRITNADGSRIEMGQTWTEAEALRLYADGKQEFADAIWNMIDPSIRPQIKQYQFDGLGMLGWNIGLDALQDSTVLAKLNEGRFEEAAAAFGMWRRDRVKGVKGPDDMPLEDGWSWFQAVRGILRRSYTAALIFSGLDWRKAAAPSRIELVSYPEKREDSKEWVDVITHFTSWREVLDRAKGQPLPVVSVTAETATPQPDLPAHVMYEDPTPEDGWTGDDLNTVELMKLKKTPITKMTKRVPIAAVEYLENPEPQVKDIGNSKRGKGYAKTQTGKEIGIAGTAGTVAVAVGAAEPVVKFVDTYPKETIAWVFAGMLVFATGYYFYGLWQRKRGEDEATDLLG